MDSSSSILSQHEPTDGFDTVCGQTWVYPTNKPVRDYQYNITKEALFKNTMVCLPTGLGKTFIAAVVMYNYFRWYPQGKIIFMAPTKPLVKQQVDACYDIVAIPKDVTAELTGSNAQSTRGNIWDEKRVFFITPQVLQNDIEKITQLGKQIKCLVFDEAHRARGNHAYCEVIRKIFPVNKFFRVLGLSATPGSTVVDVVKVCNDLLIAHLEMRTEDSPDVASYVFKRTISTVVVPLSKKQTEVIDQYIKVLDQYVRILMRHRVVNENCSTLTKGRLFYVMKEYQAKPLRGAIHNEIMKAFNICLVLYHAFEVLTKHGLRGFFKFFEEHLNKPLLKGNVEIINIMDDIDRYLGVIPMVDTLPDGTIPEVPKNTVFGHPKFYKLSEIVVNHYKEKGDNSRIIVFCEYRESVLEAYTILLMQRPLVKPGMFLGQTSITQKQQINMMNDFRSGICNTLISTSIGEEGLDVGEVDLVICFDISNKSSIRMIQRMGRTGRKRDGRVIMLATEGKEHQLLKESLLQKNTSTNIIMNSRELILELYKNNPRMVPLDINPTCNKMFITVTKAKQKLKNKDLKSMFSNMANSGSNQDFDNVEIKEFNDHMPSNQLLITLDCPIDLKYDVGKMNMSKKLAKQRVLQSSFGLIGSSSNSEMFVSLLQLAESIRYNIPLTQVSQKTSVKTGKNDGFKQSDIRSMFLQQTQSTPTKDTPIILIPEPNNKYNKQTYNELQQELTDYISIKSVESDTCKICDNLFPCENLNMKSDLFKASDWTAPEFTIIDSIDAKSFESFIDKIMVSELIVDLDGSDFSENEIIASPNLSKSLIVKNTLSPVLTKSLKFNSEEPNLDLEMSDCVLHTQQNKMFFQLPKSAAKILQNVKKNSDEFISDQNIEKLKETANNNSKKVRVDDIQIFQDLVDLNKNDSKKGTSTLHFFKLNSLDDLFEDDLIEPIPYVEEIEEAGSPVMNAITGEFESPTLCHKSKIFEQKNKATKRLFSGMDNEILSIDDLRKKKHQTPISDCNKISKPNLSSLKKSRRGFYNSESSSKCDKTLPQNKLQMPKKLFSLDPASKSDSEKIKESDTKKQNNLDDDDVFGDFFNDVIDKSKKNNSGSSDLFDNDSDDIFNKASTSKQSLSDTSSNLKISQDARKCIDLSDVFDDCFLKDVTKLNEKVASEWKNSQKVVDELFEDSFDDGNNSKHGNQKKVNLNESFSNEIRIDEIQNQSQTEKIFKSDNYSTMCTNQINLNIYESTPGASKTNTKFESKRTQNKSFDLMKTQKSKLQESSSQNKKFIMLNDIFDDSFLMDVKVSNKNKTKKRVDLNVLVSDKNKLNQDDCKSQKSSSSSQNKQIIRVSQRNKNKNELDNNFLYDLNKPTGSQKQKSQKSSCSNQSKKSVEINDVFDDTFLMDVPVSDKNRLKSKETDKTQKSISSGKSQKSVELNDVFDDNFLFDTTISKNKSKGSKNDEFQQSISSSETKKSVELNDVFDENFLLDVPVSDKTKLKINENRTSQQSSSGSQNKKNINVSSFDLVGKPVMAKKNKLNHKHKSQHSQNKISVEINDIFDDSFLTNIPIANKSKRKNSAEEIISTKSNKQNTKIFSANINPVKYIDDFDDLCDESIQELLWHTRKGNKDQSQSPKSPIIKSQKRKCIEDDAFENRRKSQKTSSSPLNISDIMSKYLNSPQKHSNCNAPSSSKFDNIPKRKIKSQSESTPIIIDSEDEFVASPLKKAKKKTTKTVTNNPFLDMEADVSSDASVSADESGSSQDLFESSFVNDETQLLETTNMHAHYMQSVRSPASSSRQFKIPILPTKINQSIFSQAVVDDGEDTYMNDSFCVDSETIDLTQNDMTELEIAELVLKEQRRKKKKEKDKSTKVKNKKRKRILVVSDSD